MKSLFISHDNRDKGTITPFLHALHEEGFSLFIDRPDEVGLDPIDERVHSIPMDESFLTSIPKALKEADIVLVFWTVNSVEKAQRVGILANEIIVANERGTLRAVLIADHEARAREIERQIPELFNPLQHIKFLGVDSERLVENANFRNLVKQLRETVVRRGEQRSKELDSEVLAMLVNRGGPIDNFISAGTASLELTATTSDERRSHCVVVIGHVDDYPRLLDERFTVYDGEQCFLLVSEALGALPVTPEWFINKQWNPYDMHSPEMDGMRPEDFSNYLSRKLKLLNQTKPLRGKGSKYAVLPTVSLQDSHIRLDAAGNIAAWLTAWDDEFGAPPEIPVLPVLYISYQDEGGGWLGSFFRSHPAERLASAVKDAVEDVDPKHFVVTVVKELRKIEWEDARRWLREYVRPHAHSGIYNIADARLRELFPLKGKSPGYPMDDFYSALREATPFSGRTA